MKKQFAIYDDKNNKYFGHIPGTYDLEQSIYVSSKHGEWTHNIKDAYKYIKKDAEELAEVFMCKVVIAP